MLGLAKKVAVVVAVVVLGLAQGARASTAAAIADSIRLKSGNDLIATVSGNTVTVTGSVGAGAVKTTADFLTFNIDAGVTIVWKATLIGKTTSSCDLIYINGGSGVFEVQSGGTIQNDSTGQSINNNSACTVNISGGTVSTKSGDAIYNSSIGTVNVSGGTVEGIEKGSWAINNKSTGTINISGGKIEADCAIYNALNGTVKVSGGTVATGIGKAIFSYGSSAKVIISGGIVSATSGIAIENRMSGTVSISGIGKITSANTINGLASGSVNGNIPSGTIYNYYGVINIDGGTVENTASGSTVTANGCNGSYRCGVNVSDGVIQSAGGDAFYISGGDKMNISGGTVTAGNNAITISNTTLNITNGTISCGDGKSAVYIESGTVNVTGGTLTSNSNAIYSGNNVAITLGGSPNIAGDLWTHPEKLKVLNSGTDIFTPNQKIYRLDFPSAQYATNNIAVVNGGNFLNNFTLYNADYSLRKDGLNLAMTKSTKVSFNLNGGTGTAPASVGVVQGGKLLTKPSTSSFTKTGYTNDGNWYTTSTGTTEFIFGESGTSVSDDMVLYLKWVPTAYTITYNLNSGTNSASNPATYTIETNTITLQAPSKSEYYFGGWYSNSSYTGTSVASISKGSSGDQVLYAKWIPIFTITFNANGGSVTPSSSTTRADSTLASLPYPTTTTTTEGYSFKGWFTASAGGIEVTSSRKYNASTTIYAQWTLNTYTIKWNTDGGTPAPTQTSVSHGSSITAPGTMTKTGYSFDGWYTDYTLMSVATFPMANIAESKTFYAKWTLNTYTVTWNVDGGTPTPTQTSVNHGSSITAPVAMTKAGGFGVGYIFGGWYTDYGLTTTVTFPITNVTEPKTFYAKWITTYTVTFDANGGTVTPTSAITGSDGKLASLPTPTRGNDYAFNGWFTAETDGEKVTIGKVYNANTTIYAQWTRSAYTITLNPNGGTVTSTTMRIGENGRITSLPIPTKTGYAFDGWFTSATGDESVTTNTVFSTDATIYARWTPVYAVTFSAAANGVLIATVDGSSITSGALVRQGKNVVFTAIPDHDYDVREWTVNGVGVNHNTNTIYTLTNISAAATVKVSFDKVDAVTSPNRVIPVVRPDNEVTTVAPVHPLTIELTVGPNPAVKSSGTVTFFRSGNRISSAKLSVYDASGNVVNTVAIKDNAAGNNGKRSVGSWNLSDAKGRPVSEGTYLVRGAVKTKDGKSEKVSLVVGVR